MKNKSSPSCGLSINRKSAIFSKTACPSGTPILPDLLRYQALAVANYSCTLDALHIRQT